MMYSKHNWLIEIKNINFTKLWLRIKLTFNIPKKELKLSADDKYEIRKHNARTTPFSYTEKSAYMRSKEWQTMHKIWLHEKGYRCQMFPFLFLGQHKPKGGWYNNAVNGKYAIHHVDKNAYKNLGKERLDKEVIVLSKFAHDFVYHYLLSLGARKVRDQKSINSFANPLQVLMNYWCFLNKWVKITVLGLLFYCLI